MFAPEKRFSVVNCERRKNASPVKGSRGYGRKQRAADFYYFSVVTCEFVQNNFGCDIQSYSNRDIKTRENFVEIFAGYRKKIYLIDRSCYNPTNATSFYSGIFKGQMNKETVSRQKISARWQEIKSSPHPLRTFAAGVSKVARKAIAESKDLIVEEQAIYLDRLPREFDGLRIVQLSDTHHSHFVDARQIRDCVKIANALEPDITVLTGDYVSHGTDFIAPVAEILGKLEAPGGVYAVLGNHDYRADARLITDLFRAEGIRVLINEGLHLTKNAASIWICGADDVLYGMLDLELALAGSQPDEFKFLLCHNPAILRQAERAGIDFIVSGHTHGGQIRLRPTNEGLIMPKNRRASGLLQRGDTQIYISRGIGTVVLPVRYQCPPEISLLELRKS